MMQSARQKIMEHLQRWEGMHLHKNRTESDITSAYGIYRKSFPDAAIFKFYDQIADDLGVSLQTPEGREAVQKWIDDEPERQEVVRDLVWQFYVENFMDFETIDLLEPKSALTYFSIGVNGGKGRSSKALQTAINRMYEKNKIPMKIVVDGKIGNGTRSALGELVGNGYYNDDEFNQYMLEYMASFYGYLIRKNPNKYKIYTNGWRNRLVALGGDENKLKEIMA